MQIIGVIDLKDGQAVHARGGARDRYAPLRQSAGVPVAGNAVVLARHYRDTFGLSTIYVADLDAIATGAIQSEQIGAISALGATLWVDAGIAGADDARRAAAVGTHRVVVGLETLTSFEALADICAQSATPVTFSLDLRNGTPMNASLAAQSPEASARRAVDAGARAVIVLDVARVGSAGGPDLDLVRRIRAVVPETEVFAGGGVRGLEDLRRLAEAGCAGALVATALHEGRLTAAELRCV